MSMNLGVFTGRLGRDAEKKNVGHNSTGLLSFSIAVDPPYQKKDDGPMWVQCALWGKRAEGTLGDYLNKGTQVCVSGELSINEWEDSKDGLPRFALAMNVSSLELIGSKSDSSGQQSRSEPTSDDTDDEIPF